LNELLVSAGLARIYGTRTPLPDGRDSRTYLAHLGELETHAKAARRGAWSKVQP
jgi:endonuclease YncB( thermonuclease family)